MEDDGGEKKFETSVEVNSVHRDSPRRSGRDYVPWPTRTPFLLAFCSVILLCVIGLELLIRNAVPVGSHVDTAQIARAKMVRQVITLNTSTSSADAITFTTFPDSMSITTTATDTTEDTTSPTSTINVSMGNPDAYISLTTNSDANRVVVVSTTPVQIAAITETTPHVTSEKSTVVSPDTQTSNDYQPTTVGMAPTDSYVSLSTAATSTVPKVSPQPIIIVTSVQLESFLFTSVTSVESLATLTSAGSTFVSSTLIASEIVATHTTSVLVTKSSVLVAGSSQSLSQQTRSNNLSSSKTTGSSQSKSGAQPTSTQGASDDLRVVANGRELQVRGAVGEFEYFLAMYSSTLIAVVLKVLWACVFVATKMMEPFYQLNRKSGASAQDALIADYLSSSMSWWSLKSMFRGHWVMLLTFSITMALSACAPLATEAMTIKSLGYCQTPNGSTVRCNPAWVLNIKDIRVTQTVLSLIAICVVMVIVLGLRRQSGITTNPTSIATMATLLHNPEVLRDIRSIDSNATHQEIQNLLANNRYMLASYEDARGHDRYGITRVQLRFDGDQHDSRTQRTRFPDSDNAAGFVQSKPPLPINKIVADSILFAAAFGLMVVTICYRNDRSESGFNKFFNSDTFGARFVLTGTASLIALKWQDLEREVRILTPYRRLGQRHATPQESILCTLYGVPHISTIRSIWRGHYFHAFIALVAVSSDVLTIAISGVPFSSAITLPVFKALVKVTVVITVLMQIAILSMFWWRRQNSQMMIPNEPNDTLLKVWMDLANEGNTIRGMFDGWEGATQQSMEQHALDSGGSYWAGWITEDDGKERWCVDKEDDKSVLGYK